MFEELEAREAAARAWAEELQTELAGLSGKLEPARDGLEPPGPARHHRMSGAIWGRPEMPTTRVPRMRKELHVGSSGSNAVQEMKVWPFGVALRGEAPNRRMLRER
ncbi:hypothetical protein GCM10010502_69150 [Kitasatospora aureofaciens]|uniref:Uncharacterized protein n=1 Tax=Kitasatospora aureofaciens TaxID=1894 RepID=A0A8H9LRH5_KITAU|nr:hypothetical protein GCM10010502_69150 [Kitasatospora aureofaciens]